MRLRILLFQTFVLTISSLTLIKTSVLSTTTYKRLYTIRHPVLPGVYGNLGLRKKLYRLDTLLNRSPIFYIKTQNGWNDSCDTAEGVQRVRNQDVSCGNKVVSPQSHDPGGAR
ncbi:MAG: hypothetical protein D6820_06190 [Lentisphaerae bacterium]|nr:MAG: hypothetical protein D6820_06190 [Lentisphaerota bacterium]